PCARDPSRPPARARRARLLGRSLPERDRSAARAAARHGQDEDARGGEAARRGAQGGTAMREPRFDEVGWAAGSAGERAQLRRVHELLLAADPPPELAELPRRARAPRTKPFFRRSWTFAAVGLAAVAASLATGLAIGRSVGHESDSREAFTRPMHGVG